MDLFAFSKKKTYELEFSIAWKIHPVVSVAQLEPLLRGQNLYQRPKFNYFPAVEMGNDIPGNQSYEIEKLIDKRIRKYNRISIIQYLMKWFWYNPEHNQWKSLSALDNCLDLIEKYETSVLSGPTLPARRRKKRREE